MRQHISTSLYLSLELIFHLRRWEMHRLRWPVLISMLMTDLSGFPQVYSSVSGELSCMHAACMWEHGYAQERRSDVT